MPTLGVFAPKAVTDALTAKGYDVEPMSDKRSAHVLVDANPNPTQPGQVFVSNRGSTDEIVAAITAGVTDAYYQRLLVHMLSREPARAANGGWNSIQSLKTKLGIPNDSRRFTYPEITPRILGKGEVPTTDNMAAAEGEDFVILAAPYVKGGNDVAIAAAVRKYLEDNPAHRVALTFFEPQNPQAEPTPQQKAEIIRDGVDQINHRPHTDNIWPLEDTRKLQDVVERLKLSLLIG